MFSNLSDYLASISQLSSAQPIRARWGHGSRAFKRRSATDLLIWVSKAASEQ